VHQNHYFLKKLTHQLHQTIQGFRVKESFTQNKNEHILQLTNGKNDLIIKTYLGASFCSLSFPNDFARKKVNTVNKFVDLLGLKVKEVGVFRYERAMYIEFQNDLNLVFQLYGTRSNMLLYKDDTCVEVFRKKHADMQKLLQDFHRKLPDPRDTTEILSLFPAIAGFPAEIIRERGNILQMTTAKAMIKELDFSNTYYLINYHGKIKISMIPFGDIHDQFDNPLVAITTFFNEYIREDHLSREKNRHSIILKKQIVKTANYIDKSERKIDSLIQVKNHQQTGDLIMANLHNILPHSSSISVQNIYTGKEVTIRLNPELNAQKNAGNYYRKSKKQNVELKKIRENITAKKKLFRDLNANLEALDSINNIKSLRKVFGNQKKPNKRQIESFPYYERNYKNFRILIGKGAKQNDSMLQSYSWKEDLWLHSKDGPGSHVLIKHKSGTTIPINVIEYAAQLAAFHSKRKHDSLTPVIYTPRKFVRKRKGDPPGMVVVEKEKVILVEPWREA